LFDRLKDGNIYRYRVASFNQFGAAGEASPVSEARTKPRPVAVGDLSVSGGDDRISVKWARNPEADIESYRVERRKGSGRWSTAATLRADQTEFVDGDIKPEATYRYRVTARDASGLESDSVESESVEIPRVESAE